MTTVRDQVAEEVRALLARRRLSARAAAQQLGWTPMYLSRRMNGSAPFNVDDLAALAQLLNVPITDFFPMATTGTTAG
ncbi:helix-turn-helix transcriptional regulator [Actinomadura sp. NPDC048394]|uniref:helix-turn-helix domain-containing protein n=1 Tax=Actinomadura sp. NPDC048394 TaxID=3158223 RepID=UPI0033E42F0A